MSTRKRTMLGIALYMVGISLFVLAQLSIVGGSPIDFSYQQRIIFFCIAIAIIVAAAFVCKSKNMIIEIIKISVTVILVCGIIVLGFKENRISCFAAITNNSGPIYDFRDILFFTALT